VTADGGQIAFEKPILYQRAQGSGKDLVAGSFKILGKNTIGFAVAAYDRSRPLVIDPILNYSTYIGPLAEATSIAVDANGEAYVAGVANLNFPTTPGSYQPVGVSSLTGESWPNYAKPFVAKFNSTGTALLYSTFLSGSASILPMALRSMPMEMHSSLAPRVRQIFRSQPAPRKTKNNASVTTGFITALNSTELHYFTRHSSVEARRPLSKALLWTRPATRI